MADNKKYYYMRLKENFFETEEMVMLEAMPDGFLYSNILIKLYLKSLKYEGRLLFKDTIPYNSQMIATITRHPVGVVEKAIEIFRQLDLIAVLDSNVLYMTEIEMLVGNASTEADRKREARKRIAEGKMLGMPTQTAETPPQTEPPKEEGTNGGQMSGQMSDEHSPEIRDKSLEIRDKSLEKKDIVEQGSPSGKPDTLPYAEIINYLNQQAGTKYKHTSKATQGLIKARYKEGFTFTDFITVIDKKIATWLRDEKMVQYLRPQTLFGTKFESYLNERVRRYGTITERTTATPKVYDDGVNF